MQRSEPGEIQEDAPPSRRSLQQLGGSLDHKANGFLVAQALNTLWFANDDPQQREYFSSVTFALTADIAPRNALEGIMVAQIIATNNVSMKCYLDAMAADSPEKRNDFVNMGTKATRSLNGLIDALCRNRGKERPQVSVGDVSVNQGGQAIVGVTNEPSAAPAARKRAAKRGTRADQPTTPMRSAHRKQTPCQSSPVRGKTRCRMHGGAAGSGAPAGNRQAVTNGRHTAEAIALRRELRALLR